MNITILSLSLHLLLFHSPAFTNNHLSVFNSNFQKFSSCLFFNQQAFFLKKSIFYQGLGGIIFKESTNDHEIMSNTIFTSDNITNISNIISQSQGKSISIIDCSFIKINAIDSNIINIKGNISFYMTNIIFDSCSSQDGVIRLDRCRCATVTHTCSFNSSCEHGSAFFYYNCYPDDFSINVYNTIVDSSKTSTKTNIYNSICTSGYQYFRCNNMTGVPFGGYDFDDPICLIFSMITVNDCIESCFYLSGSDDDCKDFTHKEIAMVNLINRQDTHESVPIKISTKCDNKTMSVVDSVLLSGSSTLISFGGSNVKVFLINCIFNVNEGSYTNSNCSIIPYDLSYITIYPHFTTGNLCQGIPAEENNNAYGCNVGNCVDNSYCNHTIGFPEGVPQYSTIIHTDLQTASFTPSQIFSKSSLFTESHIFSQSLEFTASDDFGRTKKFTPSNTFTNSEEFSQSKKLPAIIPDDDQSNNNNKNTLIGIIAGSLGGAVAVGGVIAGIILFKRAHAVKVEDIPTMNEKNDSKYHVENDLDDIMPNDDPFADEFAGH